MKDNYTEKGITFQDVSTCLLAPTMILTLWRRNFFFLILAHSVYKMLRTQEPKKVAL